MNLMNNVSRRSVLASGVSLAAVAACPHAWAQGFPNRPIRLVVPYSAGGGSDFVARLLAQKLTETAGFNVIVDNKPGASGLIGTDAVAKAPADGYTLLLADAAHATNAATYAKIRFDPVKNFEPLTLIGSSPQMLVAHPSFPFNSLKALLAAPRAQSSKFSIGTVGQGSGPHLLFEMLKLKTGLDPVHVPYKGGAAALADAVGGQISLVINSIPACMPHIEPGKLKPLAIASKSRDARLPGVQTFSESVPNTVVSSWYGVMAPANTPVDVVQKLNAAIRRVLELSEVKARLTVAFIDPMPQGAQAFSSFLDAEIRQWKAVVAQTGFKLS